MLSGYNIKKVTIGKIKTANLTNNELADIMLNDCNSNQVSPFKRPKLIFSSNGQGISLYSQNKKFKMVMDAADIVHADGMSVVFASKMLGSNRLTERVATSDFFYYAANIAELHDLSFFILGGSEELNRMVVKIINSKYPKIKVVGRHHGFFKENKDREICEKIRKCKPDILWVGLGKPRQEFWSYRNRYNLKGIAWIKTCGGLFSFLTGESKRAPLWMQTIGLEWLYRLMKDPKRLFYRYFITNIYSFYLLLRYTKK